MENQEQYAKSILGLANQIRRTFQATAANTGAQTHVLYFILQNYLSKEIYQKDIEEELNVRSATISSLLKKLERDHMITKKRVLKDDRLKKIVPTASSLRLKGQIESDMQALEARLIRGIPKEDLKIFLRVLKQMMENISH